MNLTLYFLNNKLGFYRFGSHGFFLYVCKMLLAAWFNSRPLQGRGCFSLLSSGSTDAKQSRAPTQDRVINKYHLSVMRKRIVSSGCSTTKLKRITFRSSINKSLVNPNCKWRQTSLEIGLTSLWIQRFLSKACPL